MSDQPLSGGDVTRCPHCGNQIHRTFIMPRVWVFGHAKGCSAAPKSVPEEKS